MPAQGRICSPRGKALWTVDAMCQDSCMSFLWWKMSWEVLSSELVKGNLLAWNTATLNDFLMVRRNFLETGKKDKVRIRQCSVSSHNIGTYWPECDCWVSDSPCYWHNQNTEDEVLCSDNGVRSNATILAVVGKCIGTTEIYSCWEN